MTTIQTDLVELNQTSGFIELYELDATVLGGGIWHFTNNVDVNGNSVLFGNTFYMALPIKTEGWDFTSTGQTPKPTLTVSNVNKTLLGAVSTLGDLVGAKLTRYRTYEKYLASGSSPDGSKYIGPDVYLIEQKVGHNKNFITWQMTSIIDRMGMKLPRRQVLKDKGFVGVARTRIR